MYECVCMNGWIDLLIDGWIDTSMHLCAPVCTSSLYLRIGIALVRVFTFIYIHDMYICVLYRNCIHLHAWCRQTQTDAAIHHRFMQEIPFRMPIPAVISTSVIPPAPSQWNDVTNCSLPPQLFWDCHQTRGLRDHQFLFPLTSWETRWNSERYHPLIHAMLTVAHCWVIVIIGVYKWSHTWMSWEGTEYALPTVGS